MGTKERISNFASFLTTVAEFLSSSSRVYTVRRDVIVNTEGIIKLQKMSKLKSATENQ